MTGKLLTLDGRSSPRCRRCSRCWTCRWTTRWQPLDPLQRRQRTLDAVKRLLLRESQVQPLVVVFEDLHWIDTETQALLDSLVESLPTARLLLLVNYRPEYQHAGAARPTTASSAIDPLPPESAEELLEPARRRPGLGPLKQLLIERTEGIRSSSRRACGRWSRRGPWPASAAPTGSPARRASEGAGHRPGGSRRPHRPAGARGQASAAGRRRDRQGCALAAAPGRSPRPEERCARARHLQAAEFLYETSLFPDLEYTFKHALTHEVAYAAAAPGAAARAARPDRGGHRAALARAPRRARGAARPPRPRGELWDKAVAYLRQAGRRAFARSAHREAVAHLEQALGRPPASPREPRHAEQAIDLRLDLRNALAPLGEFGSHPTSASTKRRRSPRRRWATSIRLIRVAGYLQG